MKFPFFVIRSKLACSRRGVIVSESFLSPTSERASIEFCSHRLIFPDLDIFMLACTASFLPLHRHPFSSLRLKPMMNSSSISVTTPKSVKLKPIDATPSTFAEFGQVIAASPDGEVFGPHDAQLDLSRGIPRFYVMHLHDRELRFAKITHHASVTQCLGSIGGDEWFLGVAKPLVVDESEIDGAVKSAAGHYYLPPCPDDVRVFRVAGAKFLKLNVGTWHAGPLFKTKAMDFYNLELSNTNVVDHTTHDFLEKDGVEFLIED